MPKILLPLKKVSRGDRNLLNWHLNYHCSKHMKVIHWHRKMNICFKQQANKAKKDGEKGKTKRIFQIPCKAVVFSASELV